MSRDVPPCAYALIIAALLAFGARAQSPDLSRRLDDAVQTEAKAGFSGAVLVQHRGKLLVDKGYGALKQIEMSPDTRFWIASLGKQFTSAAVLKCQDRGFLRLDDPVARFFPDAPEDRKAITVRQLLS